MLKNCEVRKKVLYLHLLKGIKKPHRTNRCGKNKSKMNNMENQSVLILGKKPLRTLISSRLVNSLIGIT